MQELAQSFVGLSQRCLMFLRLELRCRCLLHLLPTLRLGNYYCDIEAVETDPQVRACACARWASVYFLCTCPPMCVFVDGVNSYMSLACVHSDCPIQSDIPSAGRGHDFRLAKGTKKDGGNHNGGKRQTDKG